MPRWTGNRLNPTNGRQHAFYSGSFEGKKKPVWLSYASSAWARESGPVTGVIPADATRRSQSISRWWVPWMVLRVTLFTRVSPWAVLATHPRKNGIFLAASPATKADPARLPEYRPPVIFLDLNLKDPMPLLFRDHGRC